MEEMAKKSVRLNDAKPEEWDAVGKSVSGKEAVSSDKVELKEGESIDITLKNNAKVEFSVEDSDGAISDEWDINKPESLERFCLAIIEGRCFYMGISGSWRKVANTRPEISDLLSWYEEGKNHIGDNPPKKKVTPKEGEWWLVEREGCKSVLRFSEFGEWQHEEFAVKVPYSVKPICKMIEEK